MGKKRCGIIMDLNEIVLDIRNMDYKDFLKSDLWKAISGLVKKRASNKCSLCSRNERLEVHHNTYDRHGYEWLYWEEDLICLCHRCHERFHKHTLLEYIEPVKPDEIIKTEKEEILKMINEEK